MKEKIKLGKAAEGLDQELPDPAVTLSIVHQLNATDRNRESWNLKPVTIINASTHAVQQKINSLLLSPSQFFILTQDETDVAKFMSCLVASMSPFFVSQEILSSGFETMRKPEMNEDVSTDTRRMPNRHSEIEFAKRLAEFFSDRNLPLMLATLGTLLSKSKSSTESLDLGTKRLESDHAISVERRFVNRAIITLYHDWLGVTNPTRQATIDWTLPPLVLKNLDDLREVSELFFKVLPGMRELVFTQLISRDALFKLIPGCPEKAPFYPTEVTDELDIESELMDLIEFIHKETSPSSNHFGRYREREGEDIRITPVKASYWKSFETDPDRAKRIAGYCDDLDYNSHEIADLAGMIATFKWFTPVRIGGDGFGSDLLEFLGRDGVSGKGYNFAAASSTTVVKFETDAQRRHGSFNSFYPVLRAYASTVAGIRDDNGRKRLTPRIKAGYVGDFGRTQQRHALFEKWLGRPLFVLGETWL